MTIKNTQTLIQITEDLIYQNPDQEFARNLKNLAGMIKTIANPTVLSPTNCCCNPFGDPYMNNSDSEKMVAIQASMPSTLANYGPGIASVIANKIANK